MRGARFCVDASDERERNDHSVHEEEDMLIELWPSDENSVVEMIAEDMFKLRKFGVNNWLHCD